MPSLENVFARDVGTLEFVPREARRLWSEVWTAAVAAVMEHSRPDAFEGDSPAAGRARAVWTELLMLPKCCLGLPRRGGRRHRAPAVAHTVGRLSRWKEGADRVRLTEFG